MAREIHGVTELVPFRVQEILTRLKIYEPSIYDELAEKLRKYEEKYFERTLKIIEKHLSSWVCPLCKHRNPVPKEKLKEILTRIIKVEPKLLRVEMKSQKTFKVSAESGAVGSYLEPFGEYIWRDSASEDYACEHCWEMFYNRLTLNFPPLTPSEIEKQAKNPEAFGYWDIFPQNRLKGENEALATPSKAESELLKRIAAKYRDKVDRESRRRLQIALSELQIRGMTPNV